MAVFEKFYKSPRQTFTTSSSNKRFSKLLDTDTIHVPLVPEKAVLFHTFVEQVIQIYP